MLIYAVIYAMLIIITALINLTQTQMYIILLVFCNSKNMYVFKNLHLSCSPPNETSGLSNY